MNTELFVMGNPSQIQILMQDPLNARFSLIERMYGHAESVPLDSRDALTLKAGSRCPPSRNSLGQAGGKDDGEDTDPFAMNIAARVNEIVRRGIFLHVSLLLPEPLLGHVLNQLSDVTQRALSGVANVTLSDGDLPLHGMPR